MPLGDRDGVVRRAVVGEIDRADLAREILLCDQRVDRLADQVGAPVRHHHDGDGGRAASVRSVESRRC